MYIVSPSKPLSEAQRQALEGQMVTCWPPGYRQFIRHFGEGTYRGWMNVHAPDAEVLKPFAEYDLWEHDADSPITQAQIGECIAIGSTVDGDFLAVHPQSNQLLWLPRHEEQLRAIVLAVATSEDEKTYAQVMDEIYRQIYGSEPERAVYYESWTISSFHLFLRLPPGPLSLPELAGRCREAYPPDLTMENEYTGQLFYQQMGGYVRFNYANAQEVAIKYEEDAVQTFSSLKEWLVSQGCEAI